MFIGYPPHMKGYKLYHLKTHKVIISRDVHFLEHIFPFFTPSPSHKSSIDSSTDEDLSLLSSSSEFNSPFSPGSSLHPSPESHVPGILPESTESTIPISPPESYIQDSSVINNDPIPLARKSTKKITTPVKLKDYYYKVFHNQDINNVHIPHPISHCVSYDHLSTSHRSFALHLMMDTESSSYDEVISHPQCSAAVQAELQALEGNKTWSVVPLPLDHKPIGCKYVFKLKLHPDGSIDKYKA